MLAGAVLIGVASLWYTNWLARQLEQREKQQFDIYVKAQKSILQEDASLIFLVNEIVQGNNSIPIIVTQADSAGEYQILTSRNVPMRDDLEGAEREAYLRHRLQEMATENEPIRVEAAGFQYAFYYENSSLIGRLEYFPYIQIAVISIFAVLVYLVFSSSREAEQNRLWAGLAKETAHQLGTPISGLLAWVDLLRSEEQLDQNIVEELEKDADRLSRIAERFSSIGSEPQLEHQDVSTVLTQSVAYLERRVPRRVQLRTRLDLTHQPETYLNRGLFEWVIENLVKNAVDAMSGKGTITISLGTDRSNQYVVMRVTDEGKGISEKNIKQIFQPGFSTKKKYTHKKRGWGLGLTLVKRIVENYHKGKITVKSEVGTGTTFAVWLPKEVKEAVE